VTSWQPGWKILSGFALQKACQPNLQSVIAEREIFVTAPTEISDVRAPSSAADKRHSKRQGTLTGW